MKYFQELQEEDIGRSAVKLPTAIIKGRTPKMEKRQFSTEQLSDMIIAVIIVGGIVIGLLGALHIGSHWNDSDPPKVPFISVEMKR